MLSQLSSESRKEVLAGFTAEASEVLKHYDDVIRDLEKNKKLWNQWSKVNYLPHHEVIRVDKDNTKLRINYDASARSGRPNTPSLNDCLYADPNCLPSSMTSS